MHGGQGDWGGSLGRAVVPELESRLQRLVHDPERPARMTKVEAQKDLAYACEVSGYSSADDHRDGVVLSLYETDILISDHEDDRWTPRVIVECKLGHVTTHDALTYSTKAASHKHVHPYVRYGILIGGFKDRLPARLVRHGVHFDFMMVWTDETGEGDRLNRFLDVLATEVKASRTLQSLLSDRTRAKQVLKLLHRPLHLE